MRKYLRCGSPKKRGRKPKTPIVFKSARELGSQESPEKTTENVCCISDSEVHEAGEEDIEYIVLVDTFEVDTNEVPVGEGTSNTHEEASDELEDNSNDEHELMVSNEQNDIDYEEAMEVNTMGEDEDETIQEKN